jgi:hypothetical protein
LGYKPDFMATEKQLKAARENGKKGGRKTGKTPAIIERDAAIKIFRDKVAKNADNLFQWQLGLAKGAQYLFRIDKEWVKTGSKKNGEENGFWRNKKPVLVESPTEMMQYLEDELCSGDAEDDQDPGAAYYFLVAKDPSNQAIDSMLDRTFGRAKSELEVNVNLPKPIYGGGSQPKLPAGKKTITPTKVKSVVVHEAGKKTIEQVAE